MFSFDTPPNPPTLNDVLRSRSGATNGSDVNTRTTKVKMHHVFIHTHTHTHARTHTHTHTHTQRLNAPLPQAVFSSGKVSHNLSVTVDGGRPDRKGVGAGLGKRSGEKRGEKCPLPDPDSFVSRFGQAVMR